MSSVYPLSQDDKITRTARLRTITAVPGKRSVGGGQDNRLRTAVLTSNFITAEYRIDKRPYGRVLVDYNQMHGGER
jgi:hypothetical protein